MIRIKHKWGRKALVVILMLCITVSVLASCRDDDALPTEPTEALTENPTKPPTEGGSNDDTENPTEPPTQGGAEDPTEPPTQGGAEDPTEPPTQGGVEDPTEPPTQGGVEDPTEPPTQGGAEDPTEPPTQGGNENPTEPQAPPKECEHEYDNACDASCNKCGEGRIPEPHKEVAINGSDETCTLPGMTQGIECSVCGYVIKVQQQIPAKGHSEEIIPARPATCTGAGSTEGLKCSVCEEIIKATEEIPATGHKEFELPRVEATCTTSGKTEGVVCETCGVNIISQEIILPAGHTYETLDGRSPTCTEDGLTQGLWCSVCGHTETEQTVIPAEGHKEEVIPAVGATCTDAGMTEGIKCSVCSEMLEVPEEIPAIGHAYENGVCINCGDGCEHSGGEATCTALAVCDSCGKEYGELIPHEYGEYSTKSPATCTADAIEEAKCLNCDAVTQRTVENSMLPHTEKILQRVDATCTASGKTEGAACEICGYVIVAQTEIPAKGHKWLDADCTTPKTCSVCGETDGEPYGHIWAEANCREPKRCHLCDITEGEPLGHTEETVGENKAPTCTATGSVAGIRCSVCWAQIKKAETIPATGHTEAVEYGHDATCTESGLTDGIRCTVCGEFTQNQIILPAKGHKEEVIPAVGVTCTADGSTEGVKCSVCEEILEAPEVIFAEGHKYDDGVCTVCGNGCEHSGGEATCTALAVCDSCGKEYGELIPHEYGEYSEKSPATCTADAIEEAKCLNCDAVTQRTVEDSMLPHTEKILQRVDATCTASGKTEGAECEVCGYVIVAQTEIPAKGHKWLDADCTTPKTCSVCGETDGVALGHIWSSATCTEPKKCDVCDVTEGEPLGHNEKTIDAIEATCTATGLTEGKYCIVCDESLVEQEETPALGHTYENGICIRCGDACLHSGGEATCTALAVCEICGMEYGELLPHEYGEYSIKISATCTADAIEEAKCLNCDAVTQRTVENSMLPHTEKILQKIDATCTASGKTEGTACEICGYVIVAQTEIPAKGHTEEIIPAKDAACTVDGNTQGAKCSECGEILTPTEVISATGHTAEVIPGYAATCGESGLTDGSKCTVCKETLVSQQIIPATNLHDYQIFTKVDPTCGTSGLTSGLTCKVCGYVGKAQEVVPATGVHDYNVLVKVDATCTASGLTSGTVCKVCGYVGKAQEEIPAKGHTEEIIPAVGATCTASGNTQGTKCSECGAILASTTVVPAKGHTNINVPAVQPTCSAEGLTAGVKCSVCGVFTTPQETVSKLSHVASSEYQNNGTHHWTTCTACGITMQKGAHRYSEGVCSVCRFEEIVIETCPKEEYSGGYRHAFDYLMLDSVVIAGAGTNTPVDNCGALDVFKGQEVRLQGWIGFPNGDITAFGYYFDYGVNDTVINDAFKQNAEGGVIDAGGQYRFSIGADTATLSAGTHTITYVAVMSDDTYVIMKSVTVVVPNTDVNIPEGDIIKAEKEELGAVNMTMTATGNSNEYTTPAGLTFTASATGMTFSGGRFSFSSSHNLKINFADHAQRFATDFNRYKIAYSSSAPLKVIVSYTENGIATADTVYLEAGDNMLFNCLTAGYLNSRYSKYITSLDIKILGDSSTATFVLYNVSTESIDIIGSNSLTYLRNERYILGIKLAWGGGISYLKDNLDNNTSVGNLINDADTGRLVQQSYYGTKDTSEYQPGTYGGNVWNYNPVQGGNLSNSPSRIIDLEINDFSIYIKAQPQDWAKAVLTPSYMENVYTLYPNRVQVDNRFVDFAGFKTNPARHQELPAFYTIGYLNTFRFYNGTRPWTGGALQSEEALEFWAGNGNAYFSLKRGNTETWCAWVNKETNYGLGLYTPNIDILLAGRHAYDMHPDATASNNTACSYVAPLNSFKIVSYKALEYSYLITSGSTEEIRTLFKTYKDFASNASLTSSAFGYVSGRA